MEYVKANDIFTEARKYFEGRTDTGEPCEQDLDKAESLLNELLDHNLDNPLILYTLGSLHLAKGWAGLAVVLLNMVTRLDPKFGEAWNNLGLAYRNLGEWDKAAVCVDRAISLIDNPDIPCNMAGVLLNRNTPDEALKYADAALAINPTHVKAKWHKALALLEKRRWAEAWDLHDARLEGGGSCEIADRNYHGDERTPLWDGKTKGTVVIHGEQGMGDEIMFASCIRDAIDTGANIILEPSPRLANIFARAFPECAVYGTDKVHGEDWIEKLGPPDFKCPMGTLPKFYRRSDVEFPGKPYLVPNPDLKAWWRDKIKALGSRPNIGLAWQGGVKQTRADVRSFHPSFFAPLFQEFDANWISLQYDNTAFDCVKEIKETLGYKISHWPRAVEQRNPQTGEMNNLEDLVALISNLDLVVSVCQTAIHVAGALGVPCLCLTPSEPSWRYGAGVSEDMPWYNSVKLIRQQEKTRDWEPVIQEVYAHVGAFLAEQKEAKEA